MGAGTVDVELLTADLAQPGGRYQRPRRVPDTEEQNPPLARICRRLRPGLEHPTPTPLRPDHSTSGSGHRCPASLWRTARPVGLTAC